MRCSPKSSLFAFALLLSLASAPSSSYAWWNKDWTKREQVTLNTSAQGVETKETLNSVPVAVRLHAGNFTFTEAKPDGTDIRFVAGDDKTVLKYAIERFDSANGIAVVWVQVPIVAANNATQAVWLYHGNPNAPDASDSKTVFDGGSVVYNFSESDGVAKDLGPNGLAPTVQPANIEQAGLLGVSAVFRGDAMVLPDAPVLRHPSGSAMTVTMWIRSTAASAKASVFQQGGIDLMLDGKDLVLRVGGAAVAKGGELKPENWQHVALVFGGGKAAIYLDGAEVGSAQVALPELAGDVRIGEGLVGTLDALQISSAQRSADWIRIVARSQGADSPFPMVVAEGDGEEGSNSYFGILISNLTPDAWAIIIILGIMFVVAAVVMVDKSMMIARIDKANRKFLERFRNATDIVNIEKDSAFAHSSLSHLYESAIRELRKRHGKGGVGTPVTTLSGASINAIKAAVDADLVRENHRLNAKMVLLTIAISGGPFLGLLGTVVGVMITFAAIAAAGDVNVNAIAPGIAAALLATVAGLSVAIPALFGYNYLASRIKNISADMQIFVDELVTRLAEQFGAS
jgi:biopolymer transport protein ExbB